VSALGTDFLAGFCLGIFSSFLLWITLKGLLYFGGFMGLP